MDYTFTALDEVAGGYGPDYTEGVLTEHLGRALALGLTLLVQGDGTASILGVGGTAPLVCSELIEFFTEDGRVVGRCGSPAIRNESTGEFIWCDGHDMPDYGVDCEHGLSAALCAGPGHYPDDRYDY